MQVLFLDFKNIHIYTNVVDCSWLPLCHFQVWGGSKTPETIRGLWWFIHFSFSQWCFIRKRLDRMTKGKIASVLWCPLRCCKTSQIWIGLNVRVELGLKNSFLYFKLHPTLSIRIVQWSDFICNVLTKYIKRILLLLIVAFP